MKQGKQEKSYIIRVLALLALILQLGCSDTEFSQKPPNKIVQDISSSKVDIVFVVDNSGSMYVEQVKMANSFPQLLQGMQLSNLDFRIAIITTDVTSTLNPKKALAGLPMGALQDGQFIKFPDGKSFLDNTSSDIQNQFRSTIQRKETLDCEGGKFAIDKCPSSDERGIYSANLAVKRNQDNFFRPGSHIAFVFLTDEDVRGNALKNPANRPELQPQYGDYPESLITSVFKDLGASHTMSSHSIIVEDVVDPNCLQKQLYQNNNEYILAQIGTFYRSLSDRNRLSRLNPSVTLDSYAPGKLLFGTVGSICAQDYTAQLGSMLNVLVQDANRFVAKTDLNCAPLKDTFKIESCPNGTICSLDSGEKSVSFFPPLSPDQSASLSYYCYK